MDQFTRRIIGFGVHRGIVDGLALCSDVPASDTRTIVAEVSQHGQRSVVSVSPVAGEPSRAGGNGNQDAAVCASVASVHRTVDRQFCCPEQTAVVVQNKTADQSLHEGMRKRHIRHRFDLLHLEDPKVRLPLMKSIQWIVIGTHIFRRRLSMDRSNEHPTERNTINDAGLNSESNNATSVLVHHHQHPVCPQRD